MKKYSVCIVGGGSTFTLGFLKSFCRMKEQVPLKKLVLFDIDAERQEPIGEFGKILFKEQFPELDFSYTTDIKEAYEGMDFVFMQMRAGGLPMRAKDEHIPLSMGLIGQETCGAGGMAYGLRSCVDMIKAVHDIRNYAPEAWILNYSNPAAIVAEALRREFPDDKKILNICDQPENVVRSCSRLLGCDWENLDPVYFGLNHYGWFTNIYDIKTGEDLLPKLRELIKKNGFLPQDAEQRDQSWLDTYGMVETLMNDFPDFLPNTYDQYYLYPDYVVEHSNKEYTRANEVMDGREKRVFGAAADIVAKQTAKDCGFSTDTHAAYIVDLACAIAFNTKERMLLIVPNDGAIINFDPTAMVEIPCIVGNEGAEPLKMGEIPQFQKGLMEQQVSVEKLCVEAWIEGSYQKMWQALTLSKTVPSAKVAKEILDDLIEANKGYWPELK